QRADLFLYEGTVWYKQDFDYDLAEGRRLFVYFGAANYEAKVWLNGEYLGAHVGGFTPFQFEITDLLRTSGNFLIVKVDNKRLRDGVPTVNTDWWNYGGLTRDVMLVDVPETYVQDYFIQLVPGASSRISGWVQLNGPTPVQEVTVSIPEAAVEATVTTDSEGYAPIELEADLTLWSPSNPKRYDAVIESEADRVEERIGFRTVETDGYDILLNGTPTFLRGISIHEEAPIRGGRAFSPAHAQTLLNWARELGCNFVRLAHYPHNEHMTRMADSLGLLVWSEIPVYWTIQWENEATFDNASRQLAEMITRDKNKASIILWSVSNETPLSEPRLAFLRALTERARGLDSTRLITAALERHYVDETTQMIDDPFGAYLDVVGVNEYLGWYDGLPAKTDNIEWRMTYEKPLIISEFGAGARQGLHGDELTRWSEEYQASVYRHQIDMLRRVPFLRGMTPWILADFRSPRRPLPEIQDFWNRKGLISDRGIKKQAFFVLQQLYREMAD
ncbi:MAG: beta-glucuronidase, partial [Rhodothermia bacterium]|nr:beta-glucuronidase [Rhodothermia bacterium]